MNKNITYCNLVITSILLTTFLISSCQVHGKDELSIDQIEHVLSKYGYKYEIADRNVFSKNKIHADLKDLDQLEQFLSVTRNYMVEKYKQEAELAQNNPHPISKTELLQFENDAAAKEYFAKKILEKKNQWEEERKEKERLFADSLKLILAKFNIKVNRLPQD